MTRQGTMMTKCPSDLYFNDEQPPRTRDELIHQLLRHRYDIRWLGHAIDKLRGSSFVMELTFTGNNYRADWLYTYLHRYVCQGTHVTDDVVLAAFADNESERTCILEDQAQYSAKNAKL